jgi:hypothetical protein
MLWRTHVRISNEVLRRLGITLSREVYSRYKDGILAPDRARDYPHHHGKSETIRRNLMYARQRYLQDNLLDAFYYLGVALHYIQDSYTSVASYYGHNRQSWHQNWEQDIDSARFVPDVEREIQYVFRNNYIKINTYSDLARRLSRNVEGRDATLNVATLVGHEASRESGKPIIDLNLALKASFLVSKSVLSPRTCPALETQLKDVLSQHETFLRNAEIEASNKIIRLIEERDQLQNKKVPPTGLVSKIKNWITGIRIASKDRAALHKNSDYVLRRHLKNVADYYGRATNRTVAPYVGWYNFQVPKINIDIVKRDLLSVQEIAGYFGVGVSSMKESLRKGNVPSFYIGNKELIRRPELDRILGQFPLKGFKEYPA